MPARPMASCTASATLVIIAVRPMSSGSSTSLIANPTDSRGSDVATADSEGTVAKIVACGLMHAVRPAGPDDRYLGHRLRLRLPFAVSTSRKARSAMIRV